jgi:hypothetical protein
MIRLLSLLTYLDESLRTLSEGDLRKSPGEVERGEEARSASSSSPESKLQNLPVRIGKAAAVASPAPESPIPEPSY